MVCQNNCEYSSYSLDTKYVKCECGNNKNMTTLDLKHLNKDNILNSFLSTLQSTNYKVMRCYNLVFNFKIFKINYGSIITLLFFIVYIIFMIFYSHKEINPLKVEISKILFVEQNKEEKIKFNKFEKKQFQQYQSVKIKEKVKPNAKRYSKKKGNNPPKKQIAKKPNAFSVEEEINQTESESYNTQVFGKGSRTDLKNRKTNLPKKATKSKFYSPKNNKKNNELKLSNYNENKNTVDKFYEHKNEGELQQKEKRLDHFELNNLDYDEACELDKRGFCTTYWSVLMREHLGLFTFFACTDYNLFYIKMERFITLICIEMTVNGLFFVHESMHKKYVNGEEFTFVQKEKFLAGMAGRVFWGGRYVPVVCKRRFQSDPWRYAGLHLCADVQRSYFVLRLLCQTDQSH